MVQTNYAQTIVTIVPTQTSADIIVKVLAHLVGNQIAIINVAIGIVQVTEQKI